MPGHVKVGGTWRSLVAPLVRISPPEGLADQWRSMVSAFVKIDGAWRPWFSTVVAPSFVVTSRTTTTIDYSITNYDNRYTYTITTNVGTITAPTASTRRVTVTASTIGTEVTISGFATYLGANSPVVSFSTSATPTTPTLGTATPTSFTSFTVEITNYNAFANYNVSVTAGTWMRSGSTITVSSLNSPGSSSTVTVTAQNPTYLVNSAAATRIGTSQSLVAPILSSSNITRNSFRISVTNIQSGYTYTATTPTNPSGSPTTISQSSPSTGIFDYSGAAPSQTFSVTVTASISGFTTTSSINVTTSSLVQPLLVSENITATSFTVRVTNIQFGYTYTASSNVGGGLITSSPQNGTFNFTNASPNIGYRITVTGTVDGYSTSNFIDLTTLPRVSVSGGTQYDSGIYRIIEFNQSGSITVNQATSFECILVGGGGGGGNYSNSTYTTTAGVPNTGPNGGAGGGGGGRFITANFNGVVSTTYSIGVGNGGSATSSGQGGDGSSSSISGGSVSIFAGGGGGGGGAGTATGRSGSGTNPGAGGGGGGQRRWDGSGTSQNVSALGGGGVGIGGSGFSSSNLFANHAGGGGAGGAGSSGGNASANTGGNGAAGFGTTFMGVGLQYYGAGGGGGGFVSGGFPGNSGWAGQGQEAQFIATGGPAGSGGGGGGGTNYYSSTVMSGSGGRGRVALRYVR
jgi:hypothetical protein